MMPRFRKMTKLVQPTQKCYLTVMWGEDPKLAENEPQLYTFNSVEERNAFCKGAIEADGWYGSDWKTHEEPKTFKNEEFHNWENE
tara:strand:- start:924 stop:1178 length:255 start_codon:yes stop_codon:yes gene_type:complete